MLRGGVQVVQTPAGLNPAAVAAALSRQPDVAFAEVDALLPPAAVPNDPQYGSQWHLPKIGGPTAWDASVGSSEVAIAIIDSGVDPNHPDLRDKLLPGWNFYNNNADTTDLYGHGTAVAGTAAGAANNGTGTASVAWNCKIVPLRVGDAAGYAYLSTIADALMWAADHNIKVANISYRASESATVSSMAQYFKGRGGVVTISSGNENQFVPEPDNPYFLTVGATDGSDNRASFSNTGMNVDLTAPGVGIYTTNRGGGYASWSGTSFSAPIVAGVAALLRSADPSLTPDRIFEILKQSADDKGAAGWDSTFGAGRVNAARALQLALGSGGDSTPPAVSVTSPAGGATVSGTVRVTADATDNAGVSRVVFTAGGAALGTDTDYPYEVNWSTSNAPNGACSITATAYDAAGNAASSSVNVAVANAGDTTPPAIAITYPGPKAQVNNTVWVYVNASDNLKVTRVELYVDGKWTSTATAAPFTTTWNAKKARRGSHTLRCVARDAAGNSATSAPVTVYK
jgi:subtilisin family serine protease